MRQAAFNGVKSALREKLRDRVCLGCMCISVVDGSHTDSNSGETPLSIAASLALKDALSRAELVSTS
jgi:hypothetical protein